MKKTFTLILLTAILTLSIPVKSFAAGISASGGGKITVGQTTTVNVVASGAEFNAFQGSISVSGPVSVTSFTPGSANWMTTPSANGGFSGALLGQKVTSFTVATIKLKGNSAGTGTVLVSNVVLKNGATTVSTSGGSATITIEKAPDLPGAVKVSSASHPDQNALYETTTIDLTWVKDSGVDGFSYLLDQAADTIPATKTTDANTSISYPDKAVGTYYFHIRAHKPDGWGGATHFKINIKEPDPKIDETLDKPGNIKIEKDSSFENNIKEGTVSGVVISGQIEPGFTANITLAPVLTLPEGKTLTAVADQEGNFSLLIDFPIATGHYTLAIQGQKEKVLTPISDEITFEIVQAKGGSINILTDEDINPPVIKAETTKQSFKLNKEMLFYGLMFLMLIAVATACIIFYRRSKRNKSIVQSLSKR